MTAGLMSNRSWDAARRDRDLDGPGEPCIASADASRAVARLHDLSWRATDANARATLGRRKPLCATYSQVAPLRAHAADPRDANRCVRRRATWIENHVQGWPQVAIPVPRVDLRALVRTLARQAVQASVGARAGGAAAGSTCGARALKFAIYARYSFDSRRDGSITDQLRIYRELAARRPYFAPASLILGVIHEATAGN